MCDSHDGEVKEIMKGSPVTVECPEGERNFLRVDESAKRVYSVPVQPLEKDI